jgi:hypothetical protein
VLSAGFSSSDLAPRLLDSFLPYHISRSADGTEWSALEPLPAGCARPRLLNVHGTGTLLMSGGRYHAAKPPTSDVILWASEDSASRDKRLSPTLPVLLLRSQLTPPLGFHAACAGGKTWTEYSLSYQHNLRVNSTLRIDSAFVNDTHWPSSSRNRGTSAYTSLVRIGPNKVLVVYNLHTPYNKFPVKDPRASSIFAMIVTL